MSENSSSIKLVGVDVFVIQKKIPSVAEVIGPFHLYSISNRGALIWPVDTLSAQLCDQFQCRYLAGTDSQITQNDLIELLKKLTDQGFEFSHVERLIEFDGKQMFSETRSE